MSETTSAQKRRILLKSIVAGSGAAVTGKSMPESWSRPVIDAVLLPAHAKTSDITGLKGGGQTTPPPCCDIDGSYCAYIPTSAKPRIPQTTTTPRPFASIYMEITVSTDGGMSIRLSRGINQETLSGKVNCYGGSFSIPSVKFGFTVTGTVACNREPIVGQIETAANGPIDGPLDYSAVINQCD